MKRLKYLLPLVLTAVLLGETPAAKSQETNSTPAAGVSRDALVAEVLSRNPEIKFYDAELAAAEAGRKSAGRFPNPEIAGNVGQKRVTGGGLSDEGIAWSVSVVQPFEW